MKNSRLLRAVCALMLAVLTTYAQASLVVPPGLNPGDTYHVIFVTSTSTYASSADITTYDAFVQSAADTAGIGASIGVDWLALGSTPTLDARDHIAPLFTDINVDTPIYNQNGELVANGYNDLLSGTYLVNPILYDEYAAALHTTVWTGSDGFGYRDNPNALGNSTDSFYIAYGESDVKTYFWLNFDSSYESYLRSLYAISEELVVTSSYTAASSNVPIPATVWLFGSGLLGMIGIARRKKAL